MENQIEDTYLNRPENHEVLNEAIKYELDKINPMVYEISDELKERIQDFEERNNIEFQKTMDSIRHILISRNLILPRDWKEIFYTWYILEKLEDERFYFRFEQLTQKISEREIFIEWAEIQSEKLFNKPRNGFEAENMKPLSVRFLLLQAFFEESKEFQNLHQNKRTKILEYVLGASNRTAKALKNGEPRYLNDEHKSRAKDLINKIKKGDIL